MWNLVILRMCAFVCARILLRILVSLLNTWPSEDEGGSLVRHFAALTEARDRVAGPSKALELAEGQGFVTVGRQGAPPVLYRKQT